MVNGETIKHMHYACIFLKNWRCVWNMPKAIHYHYIYIAIHYFEGDFGDGGSGAVNNIYRFPEPEDILHDQTLTSDKLEFRLVHYPIVTTRAFPWPVLIGWNWSSSSLFIFIMILCIKRPESLNHVHYLKMNQSYGKHYVLNWWKGKPSGSIACTRKQQPRFYWSCSSVVMNDATPLTPPSAWAELHF